MNEKKIISLEKTVSEFINLKLEGIRFSENFMGCAVDIYNTEYGEECHLTFLMKKPFSGEESDMMHQVAKKIKNEITEYFSSIFRRGISISTSTYNAYKSHKEWYDSKKF